MITNDIIHILRKTAKNYIINDIVNEKKDHDVENDKQQAPSVKCQAVTAATRSIGMRCDAWKWGWGRGRIDFQASQCIPMDLAADAAAVAWRLTLGVFIPLLVKKV